MQIPAEVAKALPPQLDFSKVKSLPRRTDIVYRDNAGYTLMIDNLPWGAAPFSIKRYRVSKTQDLDLIEEKSSTGASFHLSSPLAPDAVELIVLRRRSG